MRSLSHASSERGAAGQIETSQSSQKYPAVIVQSFYEKKAPLLSQGRFALD